MPLNDRTQMRLPPAGRIGLGYKMFYCSNPACKHAADKKPKDPLINTGEAVVVCPDCKTRHAQAKIVSFPKAADHFVFPFVPAAGVVDLREIFPQPCRELPIVFAFPDIDDNIDAYYKVFAGGVPVCKGDGAVVWAASPLEVKVKEGKCHVYQVAGEDLVRDGVALRQFTWGDRKFERGTPVSCPGSYWWDPQAITYPHCAVCQRSIRMQFLIGDERAIDLRHWWIYTSSGAANDRFFTVLRLIRDLNRRGGGAVNGIVFRLTLALEDVRYREGGKRKSVKKWLLSLVPPPEVMAALYHQQAAAMLSAESGVEPAQIPERVEEDEPEEGGEIIEGEAEIVEGEPAPLAPPAQARINPPAAYSRAGAEEKKVERPYSVDVLKGALALRVARQPKGNQEGIATPAQQGLVKAKLVECFAEEADVEEKVAAVVKEMLNKPLIEATWAQAEALLDWLLESRPGDGSYTLHPVASAEAHRVLEAAQDQGREKQDGQGSEN